MQTATEIYKNFNINMPLTNTSSEANWFYYAAEKANEMKVAPPLKSQIPLLNDLPAETKLENKKYMITENDSQYVRLAKQRGRPHLLEHQNPHSKSKEPVPYRQCSWFYLEDNAIRDAQSNEDKIQSPSSKLEATEMSKLMSMDFTSEKGKEQDK